MTQLFFVVNNLDSFLLQGFLQASKNDLKRANV